MIEQISSEQLNTCDNLLIIDIRDEISFSYGSIPSAVNIPVDELKQSYSKLPKDKQIVLCCKSGIISNPLAEELRASGYNCANLSDGYYGWLKNHIQKKNSDAKAIEHSIHKKFSKSIWSKFVTAINNYDLIHPEDKIAVCISGGKDSMLMSKLFQELKRHSKIPFELVFLVMDPGYSSQNRKIIESNAKRLNIPITVFESDIFNAVYNVDKSPCYLCARMRRGYLYSKAKKLGCNKIALGHHYDDVIETIVMGMLYGGQIQTMMPKLHNVHADLLMTAPPAIQTVKQNQNGRKLKYLFKSLQKKILKSGKIFLRVLKMLI